MTTFRPDARGNTNAGLDRDHGDEPAVRQPKVWPWVGRHSPTDPTAAGYRLIRRPALAEIVGDGRP
jgi:hypothetical protein